ncbi:MAG TPA: hypothetical protein VMF13_20770 [Luteitalea sp.]|nr:hypothetical protein [Luteitalea sp.]
MADAFRRLDPTIPLAAETTFSIDRQLGQQRLFAWMLGPRRDPRGGGRRPQERVRTQ